MSLTEEGVGLGTDVSFTVRRGDKVVDERRVISDIEVNPTVARFVERLMNIKEKEEE